MDRTHASLDRGNSVSPSDLGQESAQARLAEIEVTAYERVAASIYAGDAERQDRTALSGLFAPNSAVEARFLGEIAAIAQLIIAGYSLIGRPNDPIPQALNSVLGIMDAVQGRIIAVQQRLREIVDQIERLESELKGYIDQSFTKEALARIDAKRYHLSSLMINEETLVRELDRVTKHMDQLLDELVVVRQFTKGGFAGAFSMAPGIALWTQTYMAVQRVKGEATTQSVWDHPFHKECMSMIERVFAADVRLRAEFDKEKTEFANWFKPFPQLARAVYRFERPTVQYPRGRFHGTPYQVPGSSLPYDDCISAPAAVDHFYLGSALNNSYFLHWPVYRRCVYNPQVGWYWSIESDPNKHPDPALALEANALQQYQRARMEVHVSHANMMRNAPYYRALMSRYCSTKPDIWGGTGTSLEPLVHLYVATWNSVNVEVRRGSETDCDNNAAFETRKIERGELWSIPVPNVDLCYRRDIDPDRPNGQWTPWRRIPFVGGVPDRLETIT